MDLPYFDTNDAANPAEPLEAATLILLTSFLMKCLLLPAEKLTSELQSRENKCMVLYRRLERWPECNALAHKLLLKK